MSLKKSIQDLKPADHTCFIYSNQLEYFHCAIPFIREGIKNNEKCYVVIDKITREDVLRNFKKIFRKGIIPPEELSNTKHIVIESFTNIYTPDGEFVYERTLQTYKSILEKALSDGYNGLRVFCEISTFMNSFKNQNEFLEWEKFADHIFPESKFIAVCAYDKSYISPKYEKNVVKAHPIEIDLLRTRL